MTRLHLYTRRFIIVWLALLSLYILAGTPIVPFHGDESTLIYMGRDFYYHFIQRDMSRITYNETPPSPTEQHLRLLNGTIPKYLFGFSAYSLGYKSEDINEQWDWGADWNYNLQNEHIPHQDLLLRSRTVSTLFLVGGGIILSMLGYILGGLTTAYLVSLYYTLNPALLLNGRRAMMEGGMIFFTLFVVLVGIYALRKRNWQTFIALGISSGLALATKHTTAFSIFSVFTGILIAILVQWFSGNNGARLLMLILLRWMTAVVLTLLVFYALNPAWWGDPLSRASEVLRLRTELLNGQVTFFGGYQNFGEQFTGFLRQTFIVTPQYFEVASWAGYISEQIATYESSFLKGISLGGSTVGALLWVILTIIGFESLIKSKSLDLQSVSFNRTPLISFRMWVINHPAQWLIIIWVVGVFVSTLFLTPLEWQRYYLPTYPAVGLLAALGLTTLVSTIRTRLTMGHS